MKNVNYKIIYNNDGTFNRVKILENIFENNGNKSITNTIKEYLIKHIGEYSIIIESGQKVYLGEDLPFEYSFSKSTQNLSIANKMAKGRAISGLRGLLEYSSNRKFSNEKKKKHEKDAKYGFYKYDTKFSFVYKEKERIYTCELLIRNDANGKKYLYDILNIKNR